MLDLIGAAVLVGMLLMTIMNININMSQETYRSASEFHTQTEIIQLARIMEHDMYKMGYFVTKPGIILIADTSRLKFKANLTNTPGSTDVIEYLLGTSVTTSPNPRDKHLMRDENSSRISISYSVTGFKLTYYNARDSVMPAPVTGAKLDSIRSIRVYLTLESPEPFDNTYAGAYYEKLIYPRNLQ
jgi:hypothetical protein